MLGEVAYLILHLSSWPTASPELSAHQRGLPKPPMALPTPAPPHLRASPALVPQAPFGPHRPSLLSPTPSAPQHQTQLLQPQQSQLSAPSSCSLAGIPQPRGLLQPPWDPAAPRAAPAQRCSRWARPRRSLRRSLRRRSRHGAPTAGSAAGGGRGLSGTGLCF